MNYLNASLIKCIGDFLEDTAFSQTNRFFNNILRDPARAKTLHLFKLLSQRSIPMILCSITRVEQAKLFVRYASPKTYRHVWREHLSWSKAIGQVFRMALLRHGDETRKRKRSWPTPSKSVKVCRSFLKSQNENDLHTLIFWYHTYAVVGPVSGITTFFFCLVMLFPVGVCAALVFRN